MKIAAIQMCSSHHVDDNLAVAAEFIGEAARKGAKMAVLPEMFATMGEKPTDKVAAQEQFGRGKIQDFLSSQAKQHNIWINGGTIPLSCNDHNKIRAANLIYNELGVCVARYDKIHLFDATISENEAYQESDTTEPGHETVSVNTPMGKLGLAVCYDIRFPELFRRLTDQHAEIITLPAAFTVKTGESHWDILTRSCAVLNFCYVVGACQGGVHSSGRATYGRSIIVDPSGKVIAKKDDDQPGIIQANIDLSNVHKVRKSIPALLNRRIREF